MTSDTEREGASLSFTPVTFLDNGRHGCRQPRFGTTVPFVIARTKLEIRWLAAAGRGNAGLRSIAMPPFPKSAVSSRPARVPFSMSAMIGRRTTSQW